MDGHRAAVLARGARWGRDESKAYGVDGDADAGNARQRHVIDWLEQAPDLPHLIARVSELVLSLDYGPRDLVILPRAELDRREMAAYSAGWADVVDERLPAVRRAYEQRITAAYVQGQEDARTGRQPRRARRPESERGEREREYGGEVIPLPYLQLLQPPSELTRVEQRGERERSVADARPWDGGAHGAADAADIAEAGDADARTDAGPGADGLPSAREVRDKRVVPAAERRSVVRRNGRPSVPPLKRDAPGGGRDKGRRADGAGERDQQESADAPGIRLSDRARALADELEERGSGRRRDE
ncbi:hypothetical protein AB0D74_46070 [Streptomyces sp. NPDC048278]|uniref:hypothetical protein n=1 Tax=Streptomyces sp. NPDC048278 TaxID=3155809 RepID=UPI00342C847E